MHAKIQSFEAATARKGGTDYLGMITNQNPNTHPNKTVVARYPSADEPNGNNKKILAWLLVH